MAPSILDDEEDLDKKDVRKTIENLNIQKEKNEVESTDFPAVKDILKNSCNAIFEKSSDESYPYSISAPFLLNKKKVNLQIIVSAREPNMSEAIIFNKNKNQNLGNDHTPKIGKDDCLKPFESELLLGEYDSQYKKIYLYINNIKNCEPKCSWKVFVLTTFVHELMHAYFDRPDNDDNNQKREYIKEIEEPLAEFGMLLYINYFADCIPQNSDDSAGTIANVRVIFGKQLDNIMATAYQHVKDKQKSDAISYYGYGACLYDAWKSNPNRQSDLEKLVLSYKTGQIYIPNMH